LQPGESLLCLLGGATGQEQCYTVTVLTVPGHDHLNPSSGGDEELRRLGPVVFAGAVSLGHICPSGQRYVFSMQYQNQETKATFTFNKDEAGFVGPLVQHITHHEKLVPYTGGHTWGMVK
jgi:hypothetical protein